jgi:hypothetical protein
MSNGYTPDKVPVVYDTSEQQLYAIENGLTQISTGGGAGLVQVATVTLTDAEIKALPTTGIEIIAAPGVGKIILPISIVISFNWVADYTGIDANSTIYSAMDGDYGSLLPAISESVDGGINNLLASSESKVVVMQQPISLFLGNTNPINYSTSQLENKALILFSQNNGLPFSGGNAANQLLVTAYYFISDL